MLEKEGLQRFPETWWCCCLLRPSCIFHSFHYFVSHHSHCFWKNHSGSTSMFFGHFERKEKKRCRASFVSNGCCQTKKRAGGFFAKSFDRKMTFCQMLEKKETKRRRRRSMFLSESRRDSPFPGLVQRRRSKFFDWKWKKNVAEGEVQKNVTKKKNLPSFPKTTNSDFFRPITFLNGKPKTVENLTSLSLPFFVLEL